MILIIILIVSQSIGCGRFGYCLTSVEVLRLEVNFVFLLPQQQEQQPYTKIYQRGVYYWSGIWHRDFNNKLKTRGQLSQDICPCNNRPGDI